MNLTLSPALLELRPVHEPVLLFERGWRPSLSLTMSPRRYGYPLKFRLRVLREYLTTKKTEVQIARQFGVSVISIARWQKRYGQNGRSVLASNKKPLR